jgi:serine/threonine protein kinase
VKLDEIQCEIKEKQKGFCLSKNGKACHIKCSGKEDFENWRRMLARKSLFINCFETEFDVKTHIGSGAFADVFLVQRKGMTQLFAAKVFNKSSVNRLGRPDRVKRIRKLIEIEKKNNKKQFFFS